jgi:hypothetical protein
MSMDRIELSFGWRLWLALVADMAIVAVHLPALDRARSNHTHFWYGHPWHDTTIDFFIFIFLAVAFVAAVPVVFQCRTLRRYLAVGLLVPPMYILVTFVLWVLRLCGN